MTQLKMESNSWQSVCQFSEQLRRWDGPTTTNCTWNFEFRSFPGPRASLGVSCNSTIWRGPRVCRVTALGWYSFLMPSQRVSSGWDRTSFFTGTPVLPKELIPPVSCYFVENLAGIHRNYMSPSHSTSSGHPYCHSWVTMNPCNRYIGQF